MIYLDNAASTQMSKRVFDKMLPYLREQYANAGAIHGGGRHAADAVANAREHVAALIRAEPTQIVFTSGGSEANNHVFKGLQSHLDKVGKRHLVVSAAEHDSCLRAAEAVCKTNTAAAGATKDGFYTHVLGVDERCLVSPGGLRAILDGDPRVGLVSVLYTNNETGSVNPIPEIAAMCAQRGILFHTDCVQAASTQEIDVQKLPCDFLSISSHKLHGCKGVGALFIRDKSILEPLLCGGSAQEFGLRAGTENVPGIVGFGEACRITKEELRDDRAAVSFHKQRFFALLQDALRQTGCAVEPLINGDLIIKPGKILNLCFPGIDSETLLLALDARGICVSAGAACSSREQQPSHVLLAMGLSPELASYSVRFSFSKYNTSAEIEKGAQDTAACIALIQRGYNRRDKE